MKIKIKLAFIFLVLVAAQLGAEPMNPAAANPNDPAYLPYSKLSESERLIDAKARRGQHYSDRLKLFMESDYEKGGTVFLGDSITEGFPLKESFKGKNVINFGIGGDKIEGVSERLDVCVKAVTPKKIYLMIGINDLFSSKQEPVEKLTLSYDKLIRDLKKTAPEAEIIILSILPLSGSYAYRNNQVLQLNAAVKKIADREGLRYLDLHPYFADENGELYSCLTTEGLHLSPDGYLVWLGAMTDKKGFVEVVINFSDYWLKRYGDSFPVAKIDPPLMGEYAGSRGRNELVIYTPAYEKSSTNTNQWGSEAVVRNGVVEKQTHYNSPIPKDGFVVSGHLTASEWITEYLKPGVPVDYDKTSIRIKELPESEMSPDYRLAYLKKGLFKVFYSMKDSKPDEQKVDKALMVLKNLQEVQEKGDEITNKDLDKISMELNQLQAG